MSERIRVIIKRPDEEYGHVTNISNTLRNFQNTVGGNIEVVPLSRHAVMVVNEEGKLKGLAPNFIIARNGYLVDSIVGDVIIVGTKGEEFCDLDMSFTTWKKILKDWGN